MSGKIVIQPCRLREDWLVPTKEPAIELSWSELCKKLAPSGDHKARAALRTLKIHAFVGLTRVNDRAVPGNFVLINADRSGNLQHIMSRDPSFADRLLEVYRVESVDFGSRVIELPPRVKKAGA